MQKQNLVPWAKKGGLLGKILHHCPYLRGPLTLTNHQKVFNEAHALNTSLLECCPLYMVGKKVCIRMRAFCGTGSLE